MKRKIALGIDSWYPQVDGATNVVANYHTALAAENECVLIAPSYGEKLDAEGERVYHKDVFHNKSHKFPIINYRNSMPYSDKKLRKTLDEMQPDLLHAHSPFAICRCFHKYGKKHRIPVVYTFHTKFKDDMLNVTHSRLLTFVAMKYLMHNINHADYVWAVSDHAAQVLHSYGYKKNVRVMPNATEMPVATDEERKRLCDEFNRQNGFLPDEKVLLYVGRVVAVKNLEFSFSVMAELKRRGIACKFVVVGTGEMEKHQKMVAEKDVEDRVIFAGPVIDKQLLRHYYSRADLFLMPSTFDTYGLVVAEAAACGTPSLVAENSSAEEIVSNGVTGYVEKLDVSAWADRITKIFAKQETLSGRCCDVAVSWKDRITEVNAAYDEIVTDFLSKENAKTKRNK